MYLRSVVVGCAFILSATAMSGLPAPAQTPNPSAWYYQVDHFCGPSTVARITRDGRTIDSADTAGDDDRVISVARAGIMMANECLDSLPANAPSSTRVYLRSSILFYLAFKMNAESHSRDVNTAAVDEELQAESRIALDLCRDDDVTRPDEPFAKSRTMITIALHRAARIYNTATDTPIDSFKDDWRTCAARLDVTPGF
jgi:hypothetical protein